MTASAIKPATVIAFPNPGPRICDREYARGLLDSYRAALGVFEATDNPAMQAAASVIAENIFDLAMPLLDSLPQNFGEGEAS